MKTGSYNAKSGTTVIVRPAFIIATCSKKETLHFQEFWSVRGISGLRLLYKCSAVVIRMFLIQAAFTAVFGGRETVIVEIGSIQHTSKLLSMYNVSHN